jgi:hypothetical protein
MAARKPVKNPPVPLVEIPPVYIPPQVKPAPRPYTIREHLRVLNDVADEATAQKDWVTPEFIAMVTSVIVNLVTAAAVVGWVDATSAQELTKSIAAVGAAVGALWANAAILWKYIAGRQAVKSEAIKAKYHYMEAVAVERMRAHTDL